MTQTAVIDVQGMTCQGCVASVTRVLKASPGVADARVSLEQHSASVDFDPKLIDLDALRQAVIDAGFESAAS